jgi:hypothetical protein
MKCIFLVFNLFSLRQRIVLKAVNSYAYMHGSACASHTPTFLHSYQQNGAHTVILLCKLKTFLCHSSLVALSLSHSHRAPRARKPQLQTHTHGKNSRAYVVARGAAQRREERQFPSHPPHKNIRTSRVVDEFLYLARERWLSCCRRRFGGCFDFSDGTAIHQNESRARDTQIQITNCIP